jgi:hypothetical protein
MITRFGPVFAVKVSSEPVQTHAHGVVTRVCAVYMDGTATQVGKIAEGADGLMSVAGLTELNGSFRLDALSTPTRWATIWIRCAGRKISLRWRAEAFEIIEPDVTQGKPSGSHRGGDD